MAHMANTHTFKQVFTVVLFFLAATDAAQASEIFICKLQAAHTVAPYDGIQSYKQGTIVAEGVEGINTKFKTTTILSIKDDEWAAKRQVEFLVSGVSPAEPVSFSGSTERNDNAYFIGTTDARLGAIFKFHFALNKQTKNLMTTSLNFGTRRTQTSFYSCS